MAGFSVPIATLSALGIISVGAGLGVTAAGVLSATGAPSPATTTALGSVIVPVAGRLAVDGAGNISVSLGSATTFGVVKVDNVTITAAAGVITATAGAPPLATTTTAGVVIVPISGNLAVDGSGNITVPLATGAVFGVVKVTVGNGLALASGVVSVSLGTNAAAGTVLVPTANGLSVTGGSVAVALATGAAAGTVIVPTSHGLSVAAGSIALALATTTTAGTVIVPASGNLAVDGSGNVTVPLGSSSVFGVVKVDGTTIVASAGVISAAGASSPLVLISTLTANNTSPSLQWTGLGGTYTNYLLVLNNLRPSVSNDKLNLQWGTGAGPTWLTSGYTSMPLANIGGTVFSTQNAAAAGIELDATKGVNTTSNGLSGSIIIENIPCNGTLETQAQATLTSSVSGGNPCVFVIGGFLPGNTTAKTAIRITDVTGGNLAVGSASLYGILP